LILNDILLQCEDTSDERATRMHSLLESDLGAPLPLHISLSRPVVLATAQKQPFTGLLEDAIQELGVDP
jgi:U6 snRNA phosphodiesterase